MALTLTSGVGCRTVCQCHREVWRLEGHLVRLDAYLEEVHLVRRDACHLEEVLLVHLGAFHCHLEVHRVLDHLVHHILAGHDLDSGQLKVLRSVGDLGYSSVAAAEEVLFVADELDYRRGRHLEVRGLTVDLTSFTSAPSSPFSALQRAHLHQQKKLQ